MVSVAACSRCASPLESEDLRCALCGLPTPSTSDAATPSSSPVSVLRCHGCGAAVTYSATAQAPRCDFCDAVMEVEVPDDPIEPPQAFLSFRVDEAAAKEALRDWLGSQGFFRPGDLQARARVDALKPLWWVGWVFDADVDLAWAADSDAGSRRAAWAPHAGRAHVKLDNILVSGSRGLRPDECAGLAGGYDLRDAAEVPQGPAGATIEAFAVQRSGARVAIGRALEAAVREHAHERVPGSKVRNLHVAVLPHRLASRRLAFPAWVVAYRYGDEVHRAVVHGQQAQIVLASAPLSWARVALVAGAVLIVAAVAALVAVFS
jgi:hypothetical protein